jgi:ankyrin repeat protein
MGETPLMVACRLGNNELVNLYVKKYFRKFNVNKQAKDGWTALMYAAMNGFLSLVRILVEDCDADVDLTDNNNRNALHWAARYDNINMIENLLHYKIIHDQEDVLGHTPMDVARLNKCEFAEETLKRFHEKKVIEWQAQGKTIFSTK